MSTGSSRAWQERGSSSQRLILPEPIPGECRTGSPTRAAMRSPRLAAPVHTLTATSADPLSHRLAILGDLDAVRAGEFLSELHAELWEQSKALERERAVASQ